MFNAVTMKYLSLFILVFQNLLYILCMRHARSRTTEMFNSSSLLLKNTNKSIWHRNIELSFASIITGIPVQLLTDWNDIRQNGYFHDFDWFVWIVVSLHAFGGILVALVVKYANNILKAFACCVSIVLSCAISVIIFGIHLSNSFIFGALTVIVSSILYSAYPPKVHVS
ncbi:UDP-galactose transporter [Schistosoma japonicum]|nr:UDP-galactose transporter [Schistosoma japonicum]